MVEEGRSVSDVSRALGITENMLYRWKSTAGKTTGSAGETQTELERIRRQLRQVEQEWDILKKALSIFGVSHALNVRKATLSRQVKEVFECHEGRYGSRRIEAELKVKGEGIGCCQIRK